MSARRFCAQAASLSPSAFGFSLPKLTASIWSSETPIKLNDLRTASERRWPNAKLYSAVPRSSVLP